MDEMEDRYKRKYELLLEKFMEVDSSNEQLQNRICHIRKQIRYLRRLKRLLIQKLVVFGDRFMDVCLEIPDMEPGANVEDQIIRRVAEVPHPPTPPNHHHHHHHQPIPNLVAAVVGSVGASSNNGPPAKKRRRTTTTQDERGSMVLHSPTIGNESSATTTTSGQSRPAPPRKFLPRQQLSVPAVSSAQKTDGNQSIANTPAVPHHQVSASVEDVVNSVVFDCQQHHGPESETVVKDESQSPIKQGETETLITDVETPEKMDDSDAAIKEEQQSMASAGIDQDENTATVVEEAPSAETAAVLESVLADVEMMDCDRPVLQQDVEIENPDRPMQKVADAQEADQPDREDSQMMEPDQSVHEDAEMKDIDQPSSDQTPVKPAPSTTEQAVDAENVEQPRRDTPEAPETSAV